MKVVTTVEKIRDEQTIRFREIKQTVSPDASIFGIEADGKRFLLQAEYLQPSEGKTAPPRFVLTTYGTMFGGGRVGISVRRIK